MKKAVRLGLLAEALQGDESFVQLGFLAKKSADRLLVERDGHLRGIWTADKEAYVWTAAGYTQPSFRTALLPEALKYTLIEIARH